MKTILSFIIALLTFSGMYAQEANTGNGDNNKVYTLVQQKPQFPGNINEWLANNIVYPDDAKKNNIQGTVYIGFVVETDGSVSGVKVMRGVNKLLDDESVRVVSQMPKWQPGMQNGHTVRVQYMIPIKYKLNDDTAPAKKN